MLRVNGVVDAANRIKDAFVLCNLKAMQDALALMENAATSVIGVAPWPGSSTRSPCGRRGAARRAMPFFPLAPNTSGRQRFGCQGNNGRIPLLPNDPALVSLALFHQWLVVDPSANGLGLVATGGLRTRFYPR